jgi:hypothetical protein
MGTPAKDLTLNFVFCAVTPLGAMQGYGNAFGGQAGTAGASVISFELVLRLVSTEFNFVMGSFPFGFIPIGFIPLSPRFVRNARLIFRRDIISASTVIAKPSSVNVLLKQPQSLGRRGWRWRETQPASPSGLAQRSTSIRNPPIDRYTI